MAEISKKIHEDSDLDADKTYIEFRVRGQTLGSSWASASLDCQYQGNIVLSAADYESIMNLDLSVYQTALGVWLRDGALGHLIVFYAIGGKYFIDSVFADGGKIAMSIWPSDCQVGHCALQCHIMISANTMS